MEEATINEPATDPGNINSTQAGVGQIHEESNIIDAQNEDQDSESASNRSSQASTSLVMT